MTALVVTADASSAEDSLLSAAFAVADQTLRSTYIYKIGC